MGEHLHFVTGRLAQQALRDVLDRLAPQMAWQYSIDVLPISVAALMTPKWVASKVRAPAVATRVVLPGYCAGDLSAVEQATGLPVERGPRDLRQLPEYFGGQSPPLDYSRHNIQIIAEINHAPRLQLAEVLRQARQLADAGADLIDVGCDPDGPWPGVASCVRALRDAGLRVSIDSFDPREVEAAVRAGAELVLSVTSRQRDAAPDWGCEVVVIPDDPSTLGGLDDTVQWLATRGVPLRIDPILEPIGCGFAASLGRYLEVRRRYPQTHMLMGSGNLTELTDADSAAINLLLLGFCQEVGIDSVLTTQVINWARTSVRECWLARAMVYHSAQTRTPPKNLSGDLVLLRDTQLRAYGSAALDELARDIKDHNYRIFAEDGQLHLLAAALHLSDTDPFNLFQQLLDTRPPNIDPEHAFYLGFELAKAATALALGKQYEQDMALDWGFLTMAERRHRLRANKPSNG
jgi:dihydropteroate synthase-like protein